MSPFSHTATSLMLVAAACVAGSLVGTDKAEAGDSEPIPIQIPIPDPLEELRRNPEDVLLKAFDKMLDQNVEVAKQLDRFEEPSRHESAGRYGGSSRKIIRLYSHRGRKRGEEKPGDMIDSSITKFAVFYTFHEGYRLNGIERDGVFALLTLEEGYLSRVVDDRTDETIAVDPWAKASFDGFTRVLDLDKILEGVDTEWKLEKKPE